MHAAAVGVGCAVLVALPLCCPCSCRSACGGAATVVVNIVIAGRQLRRCCIEVVVVAGVVAGVVVVVFSFVVGLLCGCLFLRESQGNQKMGLLLCRLRRCAVGGVFRHTERASSISGGLRAVVLSVSGFCVENLLFGEKVSYGRSTVVWSCCLMPYLLAQRHSLGALAG